MVPSRGNQLFISGHKLMAYGRLFSSMKVRQVCRFVIQCSNYLGIQPLWPSELPWWRLERSQSEVLISLQSIQGLIFFALLIQFLSSPESYGKLLQEDSKMACSIMFRKLVISGLHPVQSVLQLPFSKMSCFSPKIERLRASEIFSR